MWISTKLLDLFSISRETVLSLREELLETKIERDALRSQVVRANANFDWLTTRVNVLETERAQLLDKCYGIKTIVPEIVRTSRSFPEISAAIFDDMGDEEAKKLGLPVYGN